MWGDNNGVRPAKEYLFGSFAPRVGAYFKGGLSPVNVQYVTDLIDPAPHEPGHVKVGGPNMLPVSIRTRVGQRKGYRGMHLPRSDAHTKNDAAEPPTSLPSPRRTLVTPKSSSILPSITRDDHVGSRRRIGNGNRPNKISIDDRLCGAEAGSCGYGRGHLPIVVDRISWGLHVIHIDRSRSVTKRLYELLTGIQYGDVPAPEGWIRSGS